VYFIFFLHFLHAVFSSSLFNFSWAPRQGGALGSGLTVPRILDLAQMEVVGQLQAPTALPPHKSPWYPLGKRLVMLTEGTNNLSKVNFPPGREWTSGPPRIQNRNRY
jgi:hypothetical protein